MGEPILHLASPRNPGDLGPTAFLTVTAYIYSACYAPGTFKSILYILTPLILKKLNEIGIIIPNLQISQGSIDCLRLYNQQVAELGFNTRHSSSKKKENKTKNKNNQPNKNPALNHYLIKEQYLVL